MFGRLASRLPVAGLAAMHSFVFQEVGPMG